jgi:putative oxidoreductase
MRIRDDNHPAADVGLLALRAVAGGLLAGHGAQKLFGSFGGHGLEGTAGWLESMGLRPGKAWAAMAGGSELGAGLLSALGLLHPVGPIAAVGPMVMAWAKAHAGKPIWVTSGGAELPLLNIAAFGALALAGPGRLSLDSAFEIDTPRLLAVATALGVAGGIAAGVLTQPGAPERQALEPAAAPVAEGLSNESGTVLYGGLAADLDPEQVDAEAEVGGDPPGAFGFNLRGASDRTGEQ